MRTTETISTMGMKGMKGIEDTKETKSITGIMVIMGIMRTMAEECKPDGGTEGGTISKNGTSCLDDLSSRGAFGKKKALPVNRRNTKEAAKKSEINE